MIATGYVCLGLLVGVLCGLSSSPIAGAFMAALFTFAGGSAAHILERKPAERRLIGMVILCFSASCLTGLIGGIAVKDNRLLSFTDAAKSGIPYLKANPVGAIDAIHLKYSNHDISADEAYRQLRAEVERSIKGVK
jgi:hypothetical protein